MELFRCRQCCLVSPAIFVRKRHRALMWDWRNLRATTQVIAAKSMPAQKKMRLATESQAQNAVKNSSEERCKKKIAANGKMSVLPAAVAVAMAVHAERILNEYLGLQTLDISKVTQFSDRAHEHKSHRQTSSYPSFCLSQARCWHKYNYRHFYHHF